MELHARSDETRYGIPSADQILQNRFYTVGYSYYFRQAKWALEIVSKDEVDVERLDNFRPDYRVPRRFRADKQDYKGSGYDRGHLVSSANQNENDLQNSETFLLSNMSPQEPQFNRQIWRKLESKVRELNERDTIFETYVISGPIFDFSKKIELIGTNDSNNVEIPVPHAYFKSILTEQRDGDLEMWSFVLPNEASDKPFSAFSVPTTQVEVFAGILLWPKLIGPEIEKEKSRVRNFWE